MTYQKRAVFYQILYLIGFLCFLTPAFAQIRSLPLTLNIELVDTLHREDFNKVKKQLTTQKTFQDSFAIKKELQQIILKLNSSGYLTASFDEVTHDSLSYNAKLFLGNYY